MRIEEVIRNIQYVILDDNSREVAMFNMFLNGDTGTIYSLLGRERGVLKTLAKEVPKIMSKYNLKNIQAVMEEKTAKKIKNIMYLIPLWSIKILNKVEYANKEMVMIEIKRK